MGGWRKKMNKTENKSETFDEPLQSLMKSADIVAHNILSGSMNRHGLMGLEIKAARVTDRTGLDTLHVKMMETLTFHLFIHAHDAIDSPNAGIHLYDRFGNLVFATGTRQLRKRVRDLLAGDELIVRMDIQFNVQPGEYTFSLGASEPLPEENPNIGVTHDRHEKLGPLVVTAEDNGLMPFYGIAQLPVQVAYKIIGE
jgi:hypothetical protein